MLRLLTRKGLIRRFYRLHQAKTNKNSYLIYPNYTRLTNTNLRLVMFARHKGGATLTLTALRIINCASGSSNFVLKTGKGLITHQEAIKLGIGGILVCFIH
jgi:ribosomal protein S8